MKLEFTISAGSRLLNSLIGLLCCSLALFLFSGNNLAGLQHLLLILPLILFIGGALIVINQFKAKIIIEGDHIKRINVFLNSQLKACEIKGVRFGSRYFVIESISGNRIMVNNYDNFRNADQLVSWLKENFIDLNAVALHEQRLKILLDERLGTTQTEREEKLSWARQVAIAYNVIGFFICFVVIPFNDISISLLQLLYPLLGIAIMYLSKGLIRFVSDSARSEYMWIVLGFIMPVFTMLFKSLSDYDISDHAHIWLPFGVVGVIVMTLLFVVGLNRTIPIRGQLLVMLIVAFGYAYGAVVQINCVFDRSEPKTISVPIVKKWEGHNKGTSYHLKLTSWDQDKTPKSIEVSRSTFDQYETGRNINIYLKEGLLYVPWFYIKE